MNRNRLAPIWWAARVGSSVRAATAVIALVTASIEPTRSRRWRPAVSSGRISVYDGRRRVAGRRWRRTVTRNATPAASCTSTVESAEPATPQSKPNTNRTSSTTLTALAVSRITSGVR